MLLHSSGLLWPPSASALYSSSFGGPGSNSTVVGSLSHDATESMRIAAAAPKMTRSRVTATRCSFMVGSFRWCTDTSPRYQREDRSGSLRRVRPRHRRGHDLLVQNPVDRA